MFFMKTQGVKMKEIDKNISKMFNVFDELAALTLKTAQMTAYDEKILSEAIIDSYDSEQHKTIMKALFKSEYFLDCYCLVGTSKNKLLDICFASIIALQKGKKGRTKSEVKELVNKLFENIEE